MTDPWREQLQPASFRGVAFSVVRAGGTFGRRTVLHEYPFRDEPYVEDMGRKAREIRIEAIILGADYMATRDALIAAIEQAGPGKLVHPTLGEMTVSVTDGGVSIDESTSEGGSCRITFSCIESGQARFPSAQVATQDVVKQRAGVAKTALEDAFKGRFSLGGLPSWAQDSAIARARSFLDQVSSAVGPLANAASARGAVLAIVNRVSPAIGAYVSDAVRFAGEVLALVGAVRDGLSPREASRTLGSLSTFGAGDAMVITATPIRRQEAQNRDVMIELCRGAAAIERAQAVSELEFTDYQDAVAVRDSVVEQLDLVAEGTTDDALFNAIAGLRAAVVADVTARGADLARLVTVTPPATLPALVLAYDLYADATREADIVARNRVPHPGFLVAGQGLEVPADA